MERDVPGFQDCLEFGNMLLFLGELEGNMADQSPSGGIFAVIATL